MSIKRIIVGIFYSEKYLAINPDNSLKELVRLECFYDEILLALSKKIRS